MVPLFVCICINAQLSIDNVNTNYIIDFETTVDGINNGVYNASGFSPTPSDGQLDSDGIIIQGCSDGDMDFGEEKISSDFSRGVSQGGVTTGGLYAFNVEEGSYALGFQPTSGDLTEGEIVLKLSNSTGVAIADILLHYDIWSFNDQDRGSSLDLSYSLDGIDFTPVTDLDFISETTQQDPASWMKITRAVTISMQISSGEYAYLKWTTDDAGGSNSRDELAIDNIIIEARSSGSTTLVAKNDAKKILILPNPFNTHIVIQSTNKLNQVDLYDISGKLIMSKNRVFKDKVIIPTSDLSVGLYIVKAIDMYGNVLTKKVYKTN